MAYLQVRNMPRPSTAMTASQSSAVDSRTSPRGMMPALATATSIRPKASTAARTAARQSASRDVPDDGLDLGARRRELVAEPLERVAWMSWTTRRAPSAAKRTVVARPIPKAAPVTRQDLP
jgi:hypothetical protein